MVETKLRLIGSEAFEYTGRAVRAWKNAAKTRIDDRITEPSSPLFGAYRARW